MEYVTLEEAATLLGIKRPTVYYYIKNLGLQKYRLRHDRKTYLKRSDLPPVQEAMDAAAQSTGAILISES